MQVNAPRLRKASEQVVYGQRNGYLLGGAHVAVLPSAICRQGPSLCMCCHPCSDAGCRRGRHAAVTPVCNLRACPTTCNSDPSYTYSSVCAIADLPSEAADRIAELVYIRKNVQ